MSVLKHLCVLCGSLSMGVSIFHWLFGTPEQMTCWGVFACMMFLSSIMLGEVSGE